MRRLTGIIIIALAAIFMTALPYMRHHHHGSEICMSEKHCHADGHHGGQPSDHNPAAHHSAHTDTGLKISLSERMDIQPVDAGFIAVPVHAPAVRRAEESEPLCRNMADISPGDDPDGALHGRRGPPMKFDSKC